MKKLFSWLFISAILLSICIVFTGCKNETDPIRITDLDLTLKISMPVTDNNPVLTYNGGQYSLAITWKDQDGIILTGAFEGGEIYIATVVITAKTGYTLNGLTANSFHYTGSISCVYNPAEKTITILFAATDYLLIVSDFNLTDKILMPENGVVPKSSYYGQQYVLSIIWKLTDSGTLLGNDAFEPLTSYTATATVNVSSYMWPDGTITFTHEDSNDVTFDKSTFTIIVNFPETDPPPSPNIISGSIAGDWRFIAGQRIPVELQAGRTYELGAIYKGLNTINWTSWAGAGTYIQVVRPMPGDAGWLQSIGLSLLFESADDWVIRSNSITAGTTENVVLIFTNANDAGPGPISVKEIWFYDITDGPNTDNILLDGNFTYVNAMNIFPLVGYADWNRAFLSTVRSDNGWVIRSDWKFTPTED